MLRSWIKDLERERSVSRSRAGEDSTEAETDLSTVSLEFIVRECWEAIEGFILKNMFIWLCLVLVVACRIFCRVTHALCLQPGLYTCDAWAHVAVHVA